MSFAYTVYSSDPYGLPASLCIRSLMEFPDLSGETRTITASCTVATRYWIVLFEVAPTAATAASAASSSWTGSPSAPAAAASAPPAPSAARYPLPGDSSLAWEGADAMCSSILSLMGPRGMLRARRPVRTASYWSGNPLMSWSHEATQVSGTSSENMRASEWHISPMADPPIRKVTDAFTTLSHVRQYLRWSEIEMHTHAPCAPSAARRIASSIITLARSSLGTRPRIQPPRMSHILLVPGLRSSKSVPWQSGHLSRSTPKQAWAFWLFDAPLCPRCPPRVFLATTGSPPSAAAAASSSTAALAPAAASSPSPSPSSAPQLNASLTTALYLARVFS